jgi:hypothetical protein
MSDQESKATTPISKDEIQKGLMEKLVNVVNDLKQSMQEDMKEVRADIRILIESDRSLSDRMMRAEKRGDEFAEWRARASDRAKQPSQVDLELQASFAQERAARDELQKKVDLIEQETSAQTRVLHRLDKLAHQPAIKVILHAIAVGLVAYLASKGIHLGGN